MSNIAGNLYRKLKICLLVKFPIKDTILRQCRSWNIHSIHTYINQYRCYKDQNHALYSDYPHLCITSYKMAYCPKKDYIGEVQPDSCHLIKHNLFFLSLYAQTLVSVNAYQAIPKLLIFQLHISYFCHSFRPTLSVNISV